MYARRCVVMGLVAPAALIMFYDRITISVQSWLLLIGGRMKVNQLVIELEASERIVCTRVVAGTRHI